MKNLSQTILPFFKAERNLLLAISTVFMLWGLAFIYRSSLIGIDGNRYFVLFDDAMISMRYAWNFSHGLGLVWNSGERVEGYTNLLMVLLMAIATGLFQKSVAVLFVQLTGMVFTLGTAICIVKIAEVISPEMDEKQPRLLRILAFIGTLFYYPLTYWSLMGMETGLLAFLMTLSVMASLLYAKNREPKFLFLTTFLLGLAFLTRNDSAIYAVLIFLFLGAAPKSDKRDWLPFFSSLLIYGLFIIGQVAFRYYYYGKLLPNTYTLKLVGIPLVVRLRDGLAFVEPFIGEIQIVLFVALTEVVFGYKREKLYLVSFVFAALAYQIYVGGEPWPFWRIMAPFVPLLILVFIMAVAEIIYKISNTTFSEYLSRNRAFSKQQGAEVAILFVTFIVIFLLNFRFLGEILLINKPYQTLDNADNMNIALAIDAITKNDASVGVFYAGTIPYYTGRKSVDFLGKSDPYIASLPPDIAQDGWAGKFNAPGHNKFNLDYSIRQLRPTYVQGFRWGPQNVTNWASSYYVTVQYKGVLLHLLKDSPSVDWGKVTLVEN